MPIFDYRCESCGYIFDVLQKLGAEPLIECPDCGKTELKKLMAAPAFHLKGKGWRNSDDTPKKPNVRPKFAHTLDSSVPHAEHTHDGPAAHKQAKQSRKPEHSHGDGHSHGGGHSHGEGHSHQKGHSHSGGHSHGGGHSHDHDDAQKHKPKGGMEKLVRTNMDKRSKGHSHDHGNDHGHSHGHKHDHKHD